MLKKKADLGVAQDEEGWVIVDKETSKGVRVPDKQMLQLTMVIWEHCDDLEPEELEKQLIGPTDVSDEQKKMVHQTVSNTLDFFVKAGWAEKIGKKSKKKSKKKTKKKPKKKKTKKKSKKKKSKKKK